MPDGSLVQDQYSGIVYFSPTFYLLNVLFIPNFSCNLVLVSKHYQFKLFTNISSNSLSNIGLKELEDDWFRQACKWTILHGRVSQVNKISLYSHISQIGYLHPSISNDELWHYRLGHLSRKWLHVLSQNFSTKYCPNNMTIPCNICQCLSYTLSNSNATHAFGLVHFDIWDLLTQLQFMATNIF